MVPREVDQFRELTLYFISTKQWSEAYELHRQAFGSSPSDARLAVSELARRYGYERESGRSMTVCFAIATVATVAISAMQLFS